MKNLLFVLLLAPFASLFAQGGQFVKAPIIVQSGTTARQANTLLEAYNLAQDDDIIYLPSGNFTMEGQPINKRLHIYGVGWRTDSSLNHQPTIIANGLILNTGASGGSLNSVSLNGNLFNNDPQTVTEYTVDRCWLVSIDFENEFYQGLTLTVQNSVLYLVRLDRGTLNLSNSIIMGVFDGYNCNVNIDHCILLHLVNENVRLFVDFAYVGVSNSIIFHNVSNAFYFDTDIDIRIFQNNLFVGNPNGLPAGTALANEVLDVSYRPEVFVNYPGGVPFLESHDYHLKPTCTACTGKGIYNGPTPYYDVPGNPYVTQRAIQVSPDGQSLQIQFAVDKGKN